MSGNQQKNQTSVSRFTRKTASWIFRLGTVKTSGYLFTFTLAVSIAFTYVFHHIVKGRFEVSDVTGVVVFTLMGSPWVLYFFSNMVKQLEASRKHLAETLTELEQIRQQDLELNRELQNNICLLHHEIEAKKQAQQELTQQSALLRSIIDCSPDLVYYRDESGRFKGCNQAFSNMLGMSEEQLDGLGPEDVYPADMARRVAEVDRQVLDTNKSLRYEIWLQHVNGSKACYDMHKLPFYGPDGLRLGLVGFGRDVTERKEAEQTLEKVAKDKTRYISTISHELRTPLNGIVGLSRMLKETCLSEEQRRWVNTIFSSALSLGNIFNDIIDMDKLDRDAIEIVNEAVGLAEFVDEVSEFGLLQAKEKKLNFVADNQLPRSLIASIDPTRVRQVLWNLMSNAVKFTEQGEVGLRTWCDQDNLYFSISDTGPGIPKEAQDKVFEMYYQVQIDGVKNASGSGIGLAVTKQLINSMQGEIKLHSEVHQGCTFTIQLPLMRLKKLTEEQGFEHKLSILLVEDIPLNVTVATGLLEKQGHKVEVAMTGADALHMAVDKCYQLVLLDMKLPDFDGTQVAKMLREHGHNTKTPIIALTANVEYAEDYLNFGINDVLEKPLNMSKLNTLLGKLFDSEVVETVGEGEAEQADEQVEVLSEYNFSEYLDAFGSDLFGKNIEMFERLAPGYIADVQSALDSEDLRVASEHFHKLKGASAAVALERLRLLSAQGEKAATLTAMRETMDEIQAHFEPDIEVLKQEVQKRQG